MISPYNHPFTPANQIQVSKKPIVTNQKVTLKEGSNITLQGIDPNNKSLNFSIFTQPAKGAITVVKTNYEWESLEKWNERTNEELKGLNEPVTASL